MERYLRVNLLGPGPRLIKKNLPDRGLTKFEKHMSRLQSKKSVCCSLNFGILYIFNTEHVFFLR